MTSITSLPSSPKKMETAFFNNNYQMDKDVRDYTKITIMTPIPTTQRTLRIHIPQLVDPLLLLDPEQIIIGRAKGQNRLDLSYQYAKLLGVSREHAEIRFHDNTYFVTDLGSTNGTFLNNKKIVPTKAYRVEQNDQLRFGHFVAIISYS